METTTQSSEYSPLFYEDLISQFFSSNVEAIPQTSAQHTTIPINSRNSTSSYDTFSDLSSHDGLNILQQHPFYCPCCAIPWTQYNAFLSHLNSRNFANFISCRQPSCSRTFVHLNNYLDHLKYDHMQNYETSFSRSTEFIRTFFDDNNNCLVLFIVIVFLVFIAIISFILIHEFTK